MNWSTDEQVCFIDGYGYALNENLYSICIGQQDLVERILKFGDIPNGYKCEEIINQILEDSNRGYNKSGESNMERKSSHGIIRRKQRAVRHFKK